MGRERISMSEGRAGREKENPKQAQHFKLSLMEG